MLLGKIQTFYHVPQRDAWTLLPPLSALAPRALLCLHDVFWVGSHGSSGAFAVWFLHPESFPHPGISYHSLPYFFNLCSVVVFLERPILPVSSKVDASHPQLYSCMSPCPAEMITNDIMLQMLYIYCLLPPLVCNLSVVSGLCVWLTAVSPVPRTALKWMKE